VRSEVARIQHELKATTVYVTHDQVEAMTMGDRVALMRRGVLQQVDTPMRLYHAPTNLFVASFIGSPAMNLFEARVEREDGALVAHVGDQTLRLEPEALADPGDLERHAGGRVAVGLRPEHMEDAAVASDAPSGRRLRGVVRSVEALGSEIIAHVDIRADPVLTDEVKEVAADTDDSALYELEVERQQHTLPVLARFDAASRARTGQPVEVVVDTRKLHFFDLESGAAVGGHALELAA
jgi:multiple sugar transport system ATP-binding protein